jgi:membrane AbrB-like protein
VTIAQVVTLPVVGEVVRDWLPIVIVVVAAGTASWLLARYSPISAATAAWGSSPGASVTMIALSAEFGADPRVVAFMQYLRVTLVVLTASSVAHLAHLALLRLFAVVASSPPLAKLVGRIA